MAKKKPRKIPHKPPKGRKPPPAHLASMWSSDFIPTWRRPATEAAIKAAEKSLGIAIPAALKKQLLIQDGGPVFSGDDDPVPMKNGFRLWMNAAIDGLEPVSSWELASEHNWFESVSDVPGLDRLVVIAGHSESQLCLDYREKGPKRSPALTYFDVCRSPTDEVSVCDSVVDFIKSLTNAKAAP